MHQLLICLYEFVLIIQISLMPLSQCIINATIDANHSKRQLANLHYHASHKRNTSSDSLPTINYDFDEKSAFNETNRRSVSRPSYMLKQFWSSASNNVKYSDNLNTDMSSSVVKNKIRAPIKWSSQIVPSIPLGLQLSTSAIFLPHFITNDEVSKSSPNGEITVINNNVKTSTITYQQKQLLDKYRPQWLNGQEMLKSIEPTMTTTLSSNISETTTQPDITTLNYNLNDNLNYTTTKVSVIKNREEFRPEKLILTTKMPNMTRRSSVFENISLDRPESTTNSLPNLNNTLSPAQRRRDAINLRFGVRLSPPKNTFNSNAYQSSTLKYNNDRNERKIHLNSNPFLNLRKHYDNYVLNNTLTKANTLNPVRQLVNLTNVERENTKIKIIENLPTASSLVKVTPMRPIRTRIINSNNNNNNNNLKTNQKTLFTGLQNSRRNYFLRKFNNNDAFKYNDTNRFNNTQNFEKRTNEHLLSRNDKLTDNQFGYDQINYANKNNNTVNRRQIMDLHNYGRFPVYYEEYSSSPEILMDDSTSDHNQEHENLDHLYVSTESPYIREFYKEHDKKYNLPNPDLFKNDFKENKSPKFTIHPIDPHYFQKAKEYKDPATLPNKVQAIQELIQSLTSVKKSINKLNPIGRQMANTYKSFASKVKSRIKSHKGPYANYYPPGDYDEQYDPEEVEEKPSASEQNETFADPPDGYDSYNDTNSTALDDNENDYVKKSFGYRLTIYRSPENSKPNITEELITNDDENEEYDEITDLTSESSDASPVSDNDSKLMAESNRDHASGKFGEFGGKRKTLDHNKKLFEKDKASKAKERKNAVKLQKVDSHDRKASNERALKEKTTIEFFEREHILDAAYNKDKLGIDKKAQHLDHHYQSDGDHNYDQLASGSYTNNPVRVVHPNEANNDRNNKQNSDYDHNQQSDASEEKTIDIKFPDHKYRHKDNAHKYKGYRERGYKIITETEFVDRGIKRDMGYQKREKGNLDHTKELKDKNVLRGEKADYHVNARELNKSVDPKYGNRIKQKDTKSLILKDSGDQIIAQNVDYPRVQEYPKVYSLSKSIADESKAPYGYRLSSITSEPYSMTTVDNSMPMHSTSDNYLDITSTSNNYIPVEPTSDRLLQFRPTSDSYLSIEPTSDLSSSQPTSEHSLQPEPTPEMHSKDYAFEKVLDDLSALKPSTSYPYSTNSYLPEFTPNYFLPPEPIYSTENIHESSLPSYKTNNKNKNPNQDIEDNRNSARIKNHENSGIRESYDSQSPLKPKDNNINVYNKQIDHLYYSDDSNRNNRYNVSKYSIGKQNNLFNTHHNENSDHIYEADYNPNLYYSPTYGTSDTNRYEVNPTLDPNQDHSNHTYISPLSSINTSEPPRYRESTPRYVPTIDISPLNDIQLTTNPYYNFYLTSEKNKVINTDNNPFSYQIKETEKLNDKSNGNNFGSNLQKSLIKTPYAHTNYDDVISVEEAPNLLNGYTSMPLNNGKTTFETIIDFPNTPATASTIKSKSNNEKSKNNGNNQRSRVKVKYNFDNDYDLTPVSPLSTPPMISDNLFMLSPQQLPPFFFPSQSSPAMHYEIKIPFQSAAQSTTHIPFFVQTNSPNLLINHNSLQISPSETQPVAVLHPNKQTVTKSRSPPFVGSMWTNINPIRKLSPFRWRINQNNYKNKSGDKLKMNGQSFIPQSLPDRNRYKLSSPQLNKNKTINDNRKNRGIWRRLFTF